MAQALSADILCDIFEHLVDTRLYDRNFFPLWWTQFHTESIDEQARNLCNMSLVRRQWFEPAKRASLRAIRLYLSPRRASALVRSFGPPHSHNWGIHVISLTIDFPFTNHSDPWERLPSTDVTLSDLLLALIGSCSNLRYLHLDNVPASLPYSELIFAKLCNVYPKLLALGIRIAGSGIMQAIEGLNFPVLLTSVRYLSLQHLCGSFATRETLGGEDSPLLILDLHGCTTTQQVLMDLVTMPRLQYIRAPMRDLAVATVLRAVTQASLCGMELTGPRTRWADKVLAHLIHPEGSTLFCTLRPDQYVMIYI